jgi:hypothetical protein
VDHLLDLAEAFRDDLASLERHEAAKIILGNPQTLPEYPNPTSPIRRRG